MGKDFRIKDDNVRIKKVNKNKKFKRQIEKKYIKEQNYEKFDDFDENL